MSGQQQQRQRFVALPGAAMPWAAASQQEQQGCMRQQRPRLAPAAMTFGLPQLFGSGAAGLQQRRPAPFASVSSGLFAAKQQEASTGIAFPDTLCVLHSRNCPGLAGVGVRAKRILGLKNINVYALGLYVDAHGAKKALSKFKGSSGAELAKNQKAFDALVNADSFERSLRLVISFGSLKRQQFVNALEERLAPPLRKAGKSAVLKEFEALFDNAGFKKGTEIAFSASGKGKLVTKIDGKQVGTIESPELVHALFDIYLGKDPVSADAKRAFGDGLASLLSGH